MSNNRFFLDAMAHIDDSLIEDAVKDYKKPKKFITTLSLAACFVLIIGITLPIIFFGIIKSPNDTTDTSPSETTDGNGNVVDTPSDENILSGRLKFQNEHSIFIITHISDASVKFIFEKTKANVYDTFSLIDAIKNEEDSTFTILVDGETVDDLPSKVGKYEVEIYFSSSVSAEKKEKMLLYYFKFKQNGYEQIFSQD